MTCLEGGARHSWVATGLDVQDDELVHTRRCVWCDLRQKAPYVPGAPATDRPRWRKAAA